MTDTTTLTALGRISRSVAHDFNNALTSILSSAELLAEDTDSDDPRSRDIARIRRACLRARALTVQLLEVTESRPSMPKRIAVKEHIAERIVLLEKAMGGDNRIVLDGEDNLEVEVGPSDLDNALLRLAINAGTLMNRGTLWIKVVSAHGQVVVRVTDEGQTLQERNLAFVFDPSVDQSYSLAQVYTFAKSHGGHIDVEPRVGGNQVTLRLPSAPH